MARKSFDPFTSVTSDHTAPGRRNAPVFAVVSDPAFFERVRSECSSIPEYTEFFPSIEQLSAKLSLRDKPGLAFVLIVEQHGKNVAITSLRQLRLDYPQLVHLAIVEVCDQQCELRLSSIGVSAILLPPFKELDITHEINTVTPNLPSFKRHPDLMKRGQARFDFLIPSDLSYVLGLNYEISLLLKEFGFPMQDARINIPLACDEAVTNAIVHGNRSHPEKKVNIQIYISNSRFRIRVRDQGDGFDAEKVADPRAGENVHRASGRGIFLMRNIMDKIEFKEGGRVLEMEKLNPAG
jgi:serine/threonine-protein kinase RsbW